MTYTFKITKIATKQDSAESDHIIQSINYVITGTNDSSPQESASQTHLEDLTDSSPELIYSNSLTESAVIALVRTKYDSDEGFRTNVNTYIADKIAENRPVKRIIRENDFPWAGE